MIVVAALLVVVTALNLPPRALPVTSSSLALSWPVARGAYHVHSERSDGTGTIDEIAAAAARAGLQFVIVTDHGDGTRRPEPPAYRSGVLCLDAVEISTELGHYVALDLPQTPYPLAGHPRAVVEDVHRFGGFGFAAHPGSPKAALRWSDWDAPFDGLEWLNADSEWRDEFWGAIGAVLLTYPWRPVETLGAMLDRPDAVLSQWDRLTQSRRVAAMAGADAHARLGYRQSVDPYQDRVIARVPSYEVSFRTFVNHVILDRQLTGDAATDAALISRGVREGRVFTSIDSLAALSAFEFKGLDGMVAVRPGEYLALRGAPVALEAAVAAPPGTTLAVLRNGELLYETREPALRIDVGTEPGAYRVEARLPSQGRESIPWVLTNPIYVGLGAAHAGAAKQAPAAATERAPVQTDVATAEASDGSSSGLHAIVLADGTPALEWRFEIAQGTQASPYAAMRFPVSDDFATYRRLQLQARSDRPRRLWAQLRTTGAVDGERWGQSFHVGTELTPIELRLEDFRPFDPAGASRPPLDQIDSLLLVIDTVNSVPGSAGSIAITDLWFIR